MYSTISDGNMSFLYSEQDVVLRNRRAFLAKNGLTLTDCVCMRTQDDCNIIEVTSEDVGKGMNEIETAIRGDALVTQDKDLALFLVTADCIPAVIVDNSKNILCLAHLSKMNTGKKFLTHIIHYFTRAYKSHSNDLAVAFGPAIHKESYSSDLIGDNLRQLRKEGIKNANITVNPTNTFASRYYFSHHRSKQTNEYEGRFATIVRL
jgi:copper oxidase (laccase) domain-containing protein